MEQSNDSGIDPRFFKALGEPTRLSILLSLARRSEPATVSEIARLIPVNLSVVSRHLTTLKDAGIVKSEKRGKEVYYSTCFNELIYYLHSIIKTIETYQASQTYFEEYAFVENNPNSEDIYGKVSLNLPVEEINHENSDQIIVNRTEGFSSNVSGRQRSRSKVITKRALFHAFGGELPVTTGSIGSGDFVLDLDYNAMDDLKKIARKVGHKGSVIGIETSDELVKNIKNELFDEGLRNIEVRKGFIENLPFEASSFDYIVSNHSVNLISSLSNVFAEIKRVLKPGGTAFLADIMVEILPDWVIENKRLSRSSIMGAVGKEEYIEGLKLAGFERVFERERQVFKPAEINDILSEDAFIQQHGDDVCFDNDSDHTKESIIESICGKIQSIVFSVRKPL